MDFGIQAKNTKNDHLKLNNNLSTVAAIICNIQKI